MRAIMKISAALVVFGISTLSWARAITGPDEGWNEDIIVPLGAFVLVFAIVVVRIFMRLRENRDKHATIRAMIDKGMEIPKELLGAEASKGHGGASLHRGIMMVAIGIGLAAFLGVKGSEHWGVGALVAAIGVGHIISWRLTRNDPPADKT